MQSWEFIMTESKSNWVEYAHSGKKNREDEKFSMDGLECHDQKSDFYDHWVILRVSRHISQKEVQFQNHLNPTGFNVGGGAQRKQFPVAGFAYWSNWSIGTSPCDIHISIWAWAGNCYKPPNFWWLCWSFQSPWKLPPLLNPSWHSPQNSINHHFYRSLHSLCFRKLHSCFNFLKFIPHDSAIIPLHSISS